MNIYLPEIIGPLWGVSEFCVNLMKRAKSDAVSKDRHTLSLIWSVNLTAITLGVIAAYQIPWRVPWPDAFRDCGLALFVLGIALRWYSIFYLGRFFTVTVAIASDHRVIDTGPYRYVRHPSYSGALLALIGFSLTMRNWASILIILVPIIAVQFWRIHVEEAALLNGLGENYHNYMQRTKRLVPFVY